jgi:hypothetical protein
MARFQLKVSPYLLSLVDEVVAVNGGSRTSVLERLLFCTEQLARHGKLPESFGLEVCDAAKVLISRGMGAKHLDPVQLEGDRVNFDVSLLETSGKSRSSFAGVYATGSSFRAVVPDLETGGSKYLASRATALRAAIDRYDYFKAHGIPYGNLGKHVEHWKALHPEWSMEQIFELLREDVDRVGIKWPFTAEQLEATIAAHKARQPKAAIEVASGCPGCGRTEESHRCSVCLAWGCVCNGHFKEDAEIAAEEEAKAAPIIPGRIAKLEQIAAAKPAPSRLTSVPDKVFCVECKDEIVEGEPFGPVGKSDYAHVSCITS